MKPDKTVYRGARGPEGETTVTVDNTPLTEHASLKVRNHSPTGFEWGYGGSGPSQLALGILLDFTSDSEIALAHYMDFKQKHVAGWQPEWQIDGIDIRKWLESQTRRANAKAAR